MGIFDSINNPWAPGGQMSPELPWASPGLSYGWGHGNEFFTPKTKEQINKEAMLQLAVLAAILVAPAIVGAAGGAGAGASAGAGGSAAGAVGGTAAESAGAVLTQGAVTAAGGGATAAAAAVGGGAAASSGLIAGLGMAAALQPFLQEDSSKALQQAALMGENELTQELKRRSKKDCKCTPKPKFANVEWERKHRDCECGGVSNPANFSQLDSLQLLDAVAIAIKGSPMLQQELRTLRTKRSATTLSKIATSTIVEQISQLVFIQGGAKIWQKMEQESILTEVEDEKVEKEYEDDNSISGFDIRKTRGFKSSIYEPFFNFLIQTNRVLRSYLNPFRDDSEFNSYYELGTDTLDGRDTANTVHVFIPGNGPKPHLDFARTTFEDRCFAFRPRSEASTPLIKGQSRIRVDLAIARTIIHEAIHANLYWQNEHEPYFQFRMNFFYNNDQHEFMAANLREDIKLGMMEFAEMLNISGYSKDDFDALSWVGLVETKAFDAAFPTVQEKADVLDRINRLEYSNNSLGNKNIDSYNRKFKHLVSICQ